MVSQSQIGPLNLIRFRPVSLSSCPSRGGNFSNIVILANSFKNSTQRAVNGVPEQKDFVNSIIE